MIMPADPSPGQVYRPENIPDLVFEEVTVQSTGRRVPRPRGTVDGALVIRELHMDGATEEKTFAPGYGEFSAGGGGDLEAVALAVPVDAVGGPPPPELAILTTGARASFVAAGDGRWAAAYARVDALVAAWKRADRSDAPELLADQTTTALAALAKTVDARDAASKDHGAVAGDVATLQILWDRAGHSAAPAAAERVAAALRSLAAAAGKEDVKAAAVAVPDLRDAVQPLTATG